MRTALPWILVALVGGGWIGSAVFTGETTVKTEYVTAPAIEGEPGATDVDVSELRKAVAALRAEVQALRAERTSPGPVLETSGRTPAPSPSPRVAPRSDEFKAREAAKRTQDAARKHSKAWHDAIRSLKDASARDTALAEIRAAFDGEDVSRRLAALQIARWLGGIEYDHEDFRRGILPHTRSEDDTTRLAALIALARVKPQAPDLALWAEPVKDANRSNAEEIAEALVLTAGGVLKGDVVESILHLLREGTSIRKAFVIRGLQSVKEWDPAVEARLIEIVRAAPKGSYDSGYYFHFITPRLDPKSDAVLDLMLEKIGDGKSNIQTIVRGFHTGLDERQKARAADELIGFAENAPNAYTVRYIAEALEYVASEAHVDKMAALVAGEDVDKYAKSAMEQALRAARTRR